MGEENMYSAKCQYLRLSKNGVVEAVNDEIFRDDLLGEHAGDHNGNPRPSTLLHTLKCRAPIDLKVSSHLWYRECHSRTGRDVRPKC